MSSENSLTAFSISPYEQIKRGRGKKRGWVSRYVRQTVKRERWSYKGGASRYVQQTVKRTPRGVTRKRYVTHVSYFLGLEKIELGVDIRL